ncbi:MAG: hypothetical protein H6715_00650 [Myxococcales bacterium]|nr:hypothetical protein [Myxococcales bacterium]MCB9708056.1 hypothetical protein [Myxococcales bacterium]
MVNGVLRSIYRQGAHTAERRWKHFLTWGKPSEWAKRLKYHRVALDDTELTRRMAKLLPVAALTVGIEEDGLHVHLSMPDKKHLNVLLMPGRVKFAPGGAKEVEVSVEPAALATHPVVGKVVSALACVVAQSIWRAVLPAHSGETLPPVDHHANGVRVDLRSVPAVRKAAQKQWARTIMDLVAVKSIQLERGRLWLTLSSLSETLSG